MSFTHTPTGRVAATGPMTDAEHRTRTDLAAAYRLVALNGWDDLIYTHISANVPGEPGHFLINPFGFSFDEVCASNLVKIDIAGQIVGTSEHTVNVTGFALHAAVHAARADAFCVMHLHNSAGIAVSIQRAGLLPASQHALRFHGQLAYHDYESVAFTPAEGERLVAHLADKPAMLLRNHGTLTVGRTVAEAYVLMATLVKACEIQLLAQARAPEHADLVLPSEAVAARTAEQLFDGGAIEGALEWPALLRKLDRLDPSFRD
ncbi:class II aldolase/adducin family protein [Paraburkholderia megapolitana]|uniref:Ribulose-5-phosphate 4-epimerase/Fuculose-1-phosphate aldolase n=1 Tax=Paraburkholderia megapolitana TaxID=420953 RepID=A0A1I3T2P6_9BURK|nr:class II aldolase/adducin family protein [Paraburkholderia megapolitana]QDQ81388.1 class II aldolase/adducin family protein [Paraburkholderia megapolitana]SFJ64792.1 Ribulose-5-phosphate 4-epimerase/Fuculose-1-phosphate aldolase [Paraburkholderia megapolitana]